MLLDLLGGRGDKVGCMTSGGTESILLAMKAYRDQARDRKPEVSTPVLHPYRWIYTKTATLRRAHRQFCTGAGNYGATSITNVRLSM